MKVPVIKGRRVTLTPLSLKHAPDYCRWLKNRDLVRFLDMTGQFDTPPTLADERDWISDMKRSSRHAVFSLITNDGRLIGSVALKEIDRRNARAEYGIMIGDPRYWGQGYGTEAGNLILRYGFTKLKLHRIFLKVIGYNVRGRRSYEKIGFRKEGVLRHHVRQNGVFHDDFIMGILKHEFNTRDRR